jgi:hypothetical protein
MDHTLEDAERRYSNAVDAVNAALDELHFATEARAVRRALDGAGIALLEDGMRLLDMLGRLG